jgi:hypothetical protein
VQEGASAAAQQAVQAAAAANDVAEASQLLAQMAQNAATGGWTTTLAQFMLDGMVQAQAQGTTTPYALAVAGAAQASPAAVQALAQTLSLAAAQPYAGNTQRAVVAISNAVMCHSNADYAGAWEDVVEAAVTAQGGGATSGSGGSVCTLVSAFIQASFSDCGGGMWYAASGAASDLSPVIVQQCNPGVAKTVPGVQLSG